MVTCGMAKNRATLDGPLLTERLKDKGLTPYGFCMKHRIDYSVFWRALKQNRHATATILTALTAEGIDLREVLIPLDEDGTVPA